MEVKIIQNVEYFIIHYDIPIKLFDGDERSEMYYLISTQDFLKFRYEYYHFVISSLYTSSREDKHKLSNIPIFECFNNKITNVGSIEYIYHAQAYTILGIKNLMGFDLRFNFNGCNRYSSRRTLQNISRLFKEYFYEYRINK